MYRWTLFTHLITMNIRKLIDPLTNEIDQDLIISMRRQYHHDTGDTSSITVMSNGQLMPLAPSSSELMSMIHRHTMAMKDE